MPTAEEMKKLELATIYKISLILSTGEQDKYTREELLELLDNIALAKD